MMNKHGGKRPGAGRKKGVLNKSTFELKQRAAEHGEEVLNALIRIIRSDDAPANTIVAACRELLDRGFGRPAIHVEAVEVNIARIPWDELREISRQSIEKSAQKHKELIEGRYERLGIKREYHSD